MIKTVVKSGEFSPEEIRTCIFLVKKRWGSRIDGNLVLILEKIGERVEVTFEPPIDRQVYRSTDYLVNDPRRLNRAKYTEQEEKCVHIVAAEAK